MTLFSLSLTLSLNTQNILFLSSYVKLRETFFELYSTSKAKREREKEEYKSFTFNASLLLYLM